MSLDMELIYGNDDYEEIQKYFEHRKFDYPVDSLNLVERLRSEYISNTEEEEYERNKVSNRQRTLDRILGILEEVPSNESKPSVSETEGEGQD